VGLLDRFRPQGGLTDPDPDTRVSAVQQLSLSDLELLVPVAQSDAEPRVRRAAVRRLRDPRLLAQVATGDADEGVREAAADILLGLALEGRDEDVAGAALVGLHETRHLTAVARSATLESVARSALDRIADARALGNVARHAEHAPLRSAALQKLSDPREIAAVALKSEDRDVGLLALDRLTDGEALQAVAARARNRSVARRARERLRDTAPQETAASETRPVTDREAQMRLIETVEGLSIPAEGDGIAARLAELQDSWIEDLADVDDDLDERFRAACRAARARFQAWQEERAEREKREREIEEHLAPRRRLCEAVEAVAAEGARAAVEEARAAWTALVSSLEPGVDALEERFEAACRAAIERDEARARAGEEAAARTRAEAKTQEAEKLRKENAARVERLCAQAEKLAQGDKTPLGKLERAAREVRSLVQSPPPFPSQREHDQLLQRLKAVQADLLPKIQALRDTDRWQRWANAAVQEELSALMEDLARAAEEEGADLTTAGKGLRDLMERWKAAGPAPPDRSLSLWNRFKTARDRVRARCDVLYAQQAEEQAVNVKRKEALCEQAEALASSTDWIKTTEQIKALQAEWKAIGPSARGQEKALWERFRKACDLYFSHRDEDLAKRKDEWTRNLRAKEALCVRAEELANSTNWRSTAEEIKKLQADWKVIGPVRRNHSEAIWKRFRAACDRFFERYKNRDAIEAQSLVTERETLIGEVESLAPAVTAAATPPEEVVGRLRASLERWRRMRGLPQDQAEALNGRFYSAFDAVLAAHPEAFGGTSLDVGANTKRMQDLVARVERLAPAQEGPDISELSPAARLATMWREALASNTMGGRVAEDSRSKAAADEVRKAQAAWQRLGYVPEPARKDLQSRFDRACRKILDRRQAAVPAR
jgi:Domain of Unknown Function (DUF349)